MDPITVNVETQENIDEYNGGTDKDISTSGDNLPAAVAYPDFNQTTSAPTASQYNRWFTYTTAQRNGETVYTLDPVDYWLNATMPAPARSTATPSA